MILNEDYSKSSQCRLFSKDKGYSMEGNMDLLISLIRRFLVEVILKR